jgi:hypothetical protein
MRSQQLASKYLISKIVISKLRYANKITTIE